MILFQHKKLFFFVNVKLLHATILDTKLVVYMFYLTIHCFLARVQSLTCTTNRKCLGENITAMLTPKSVLSMAKKKIYLFHKNGLKTVKVYRTQSQHSKNIFKKYFQFKTLTGII